LNQAKKATVILVLLLLVLGQPMWAQSSASIFRNPNVDLTQVRRVLLLTLAADGSAVQDSFASTKAGIHLASGIKARGILPLDVAEVLKLIQSETGKDVSSPVAIENLGTLSPELAKHVDAVILGRISAWGSFSQASTRVVPVYGWVQAPNGGQWQITQQVPVPSSREVTIVGASIALVQLNQERGPILGWQYSQTRVDRGGPFVWNHPPPPDKLAEQFFQDVAKALPLRP